MKLTSFNIFYFQCHIKLKSSINSSGSLFKCITEVHSKANYSNLSFTDINHWGYKQQHWLFCKDGGYDSKLEGFQILFLPVMVLLMP